MMLYSRRISVSRSHLIVAAMVVAGAALGVARLVVVEPAADERRALSRPIQVPGEGFVSSQTCRACHPGQYQSWHRSYHRTMTQLATPDTVAASFDGVTVDAAAGGPMTLEQHARELWAEFDDPDAPPPPQGLTGVGPVSDGGQTGVRPPSDPGDAPLDFVCEEDVRRAIQAGRKLVVSERAIVTPAARDLGEQHRVFSTAPWRG